MKYTNKSGMGYCMKNIFLTLAFLVAWIPAFASEHNLVPEDIRSFENLGAMKHIQYWWSGNPDEFRRSVNTESYQGKSSLEVITDYPSNKLGIYIPLLKNVKKGESYTASAYVKNAERKKLNIYIYTTDAKHQRVEALFKTYSVTKLWQQVKVTATLEKDAAELGIILRSPEKTPCTFYIDSLGLYKGKDAPGQMQAREEAFSEEKPFIIPMSGKAPRLTGTGNDPAWDKALVINQFYRNDGSGKLPEAATTLKLLHDGKTLYVQFRCKEKNLSDISADSLPGKPVWTDERVELHFNILGNRDLTHKRYLTFNSSGTCSQLNLDFGGKLSSGIPFRGKDYWGVEFALPASATGKTTLTGECWLISFGRFRNVGKKEASCIAPIKGHFGQEQAAFRPFVFSQEQVLPEVYCVSQGAMSAHENDSGMNKIRFHLNRPTLVELEVTSQLNNNVLAHEKRRVEKAAENPVFYYKVAGRLGEKLKIILRSNGKTIYENINSLDIIAPSFRTYVLKDPLYAELLSNEKTHIGDFETWAIPLREKNFILAMKYGGTYSFRKRFDELAKAGIRLQEKIASTYLKQATALKGSYSKAQDPYYMSFLWKQVEQKKAPEPVIHAYYSCPGQTSDGKVRSVSRDANGFFGWIADPLTQKLYLDGVATTLDRYGKSINCMFMGDEMVALNLRYGRKMNSGFNLKNPSGFIQKADQEVREKYGFGKFGIPWDNLPKDEFTPYRNRAYISWMHDKIRELGKKFRKTVKSRYPDMPVQAYTNSGDPLLNGVQFAGEFADILPVQLGEGGGTISPFFQNYAYWVKLARDASGINRVTACPHECDSGYPTGAASEDEMLELYSQVFRGGGEGLWFWPSAWGGSSRPPVYAVSCSEGYPLAWQYMLAISKQAANMPRLKFPEKTDTAILLSAESIKCDLTRNTAPGLFTMLGPYSRGWFRFICESNLKSGQAELSDYKIIYMPYAQYVEKDFPQKVAEYVKNGGILVCGDPLVFSSSIAAESLAEERRKLFGITIADAKTKYSSVKAGKEVYPITCDSVKVNLDDSGAKVIGVFADGSPAIIERPYGKGRVFYFAFRVFSNSHLSPKLPWLAYFRKLHQELGGSVNHNIWRFRFPAMKTCLPKAPEGKCLTNNYAFWNRFRFNDGVLQNVDIRATCTVVRNGKSICQPIAQAKLTDRRSCFVRIKEYQESGYADWVEDFSHSGDYNIILDLRRPHKVNHFAFFWTGKLPKDLKVEYAEHKDDWETAEFHPGSRQTGELEIVRSEVAIGKPAQFIRMSFSGTKGKFIISETEIWGNKN